MDGILDKYGLGLSAGMESESTNPVNTDTHEEGTESHDATLAQEILDLVAANESLDMQLHTGLTDGLESIAETYKLVMLSDAIHYMDGIASGTETEDMPGIESALRFAGIDVTEFIGYDAGVEAREGGLAQPFRSAGSAVSGKLKSAGNKISGSKAYQAVSNSFAGKAARSVADKVKRLIAWLKEMILGKEKQYNSVLEKYKSENPEIAAEVSKLENQLSKAIKGKEHAIKNLREKLKTAKSTAGSFADAAVTSDKIAELVKAELADVKAAQKKEIAELQGKLKAANLHARKKVKDITNAWNEDIAAKDEEISALKRQNSALKERESELMASNFESQKQANNAGTQALMSATVALLGGNGTPSSAQVSNEVVQVANEIVATTPEAAQVVSEVLTNETTIQNLRTQVAATIQQDKPRLSKKDLKKLNNIKGGTGSRKRGGNLSEEYDLNSFINFGFGIESESILDEENYEESTESLVDPFILADLASYNTLIAIEAGIECMNIDEFGHPYIGADMTSKKVIAFTDMHNYGEAGIEAEETATEEKPSQVAKSDAAKEEGFFAKAGKKIKAAGQWTASKAKQFVAWLRSKIGILDAMIDRLAMLTSKKVDLSELNENEVADALAGIEANLDKVIKMSNADYDGKAKSAEDYANAIKDMKSKMSSNTNVSVLRLLGAGHLVSKVKKAKKVADKATADKVANASEMTAIMTSTNASIAKLSTQVKDLISSVKQASEKVEEKPAEADK